MAEPTLVQVFGAGATQDANTLTIQKSALATVGLNASSSNTAESLFVAMLLLAQSQLTETNQESRVEQSLTIVDGFKQTVYRNNANYEQFSRTVNIQKLDASSTINPNDY